MPAWLIFALSAVVVMLAGVRLARDGETIALRTGLGQTWVGAILIAIATSLPELTTNLFAVEQGHPDLAVGDLFGASMVNVLVLAIADLLTMQGRVLTRVTVNQALVGSLAIGLTAVAAAGVLAGDRFIVLGVGWAPLIIALGYLGGLRILHVNRAGPPFMAAADLIDATQRAPSLANALAGFAVAALAILLAARFLANSAADLAAILGVSTGFIGVALLALTTTLPELVVTFASVRTQSYDLAVGNLLGSNSFNMVILLALDIADGPGSLLGQVNPGLLVAAMFSIILMTQVSLEVLNRSEQRIWYLEPGPLVMVATYLAGLYLTYQLER